jgi:hypothetical protein
MGIDEFKTDDSSKTESNESSYEGPYENETESHTQSKLDIKQQLESDGFEVGLEETVGFEDGTVLRPDIYAKLNADSSSIIDSITEGDLIAIEVGKIDASRIYRLTSEFDYVALTPRGSDIDNRIEVSPYENPDNTNHEQRRDIKKMSTNSRSDRKRGPYIDPEAYERLKDASQHYDMTIQEMLDQLLLTTLDDNGEIKRPHSVLRNQIEE